MPAGAVGTCWRTGTWPDTAWQAGAWADGAVLQLWPADTYPTSVTYTRLAHRVTYTQPQRAVSYTTPKHRVTFDG